MSVELFNMDNMEYDPKGKLFDVIYCDYIYENHDFSWAKKYWQYLKPNGVMISQTDFHSQHRLRVYMEDVLGGNFVSHSVWKNEWGNHPRNKFHMCYDDIIIYSNGKDWLFQPEKIQVPKVTKTKGMNPSGRETKQATAWIDDCTLTTTALERVKKDDGHLIKWQKPLRLYNRIIAPFVNEIHNDCLDPFSGSGSFGKWCSLNGMNYIGIECDEEVYRYGLKNIESAKELGLNEKYIQNKLEGV